VDLWALDEVHFHQYGSRGYLWVPPEVKDPIVLHHPTRKSVGYFGAVRLRDGRLLVRQETAQFNGQTTWLFLQKLEAQSRGADRQVVVIIDNAKFHHARLHLAWRQAQADHFRLDYLPPYSPELNPIERVWKLMRKLCTSPPWRVSPARWSTSSPRGPNRTRIYGVFAQLPSDAQLCIAPYIARMPVTLQGAGHHDKV